MAQSNDAWAIPKACPATLILPASVKHHTIIHQEFNTCHIHHSLDYLLKRSKGKSTDTNSIKLRVVDKDHQKEF